ncbi:hypothetical protein Micbo1qcDRAFT_215332 [Microdochium bolleyi]|uniref:Uncharacterized protein n=1 Tax=Microdochium bolleyi TaxID=196109 RepID=A0A136IT39_9PEZI|nr:hypothetical protein Micbo1qcDRAFT_215332 [Microdochium bolleyi]
MCFAPGTSILTGREPVSIESIREGDLITTRLGPEQYGTASGELLRTSEAGQTLVGINDEQPFFTADQALYTTTGYRALDPAAAQALNPWLDVGSLRVGHVLLKAKSDSVSGYEQVQIVRLSLQPSSAEVLYNIHLREGLRSFHANRYLVCLNYPEITLSTVTGFLQALVKKNPGVQIGLQELGPAFTKAGAQNILENLESQRAEASN